MSFLRSFTNAIARSFGHRVARGMMDRSTRSTQKSRDLGAELDDLNRKIDLLADSHNQLVDYIKEKEEAK